MLMEERWDAEKRNMLEVERFVEEQRRTARGQRKERLESDLVGEKKLLAAVLLPVLKTLEGITLEYELRTPMGSSIYIDAFCEPGWFGFEGEGFVAHAESITRSRFSFEKKRVRTMAVHGIRYIPFSWDEMDKQPEACQQMVQQLLGGLAGSMSSAYRELTVHERELIRYALLLNRPFRNKDACECLGLGEDTSREILRKLLEKKMIRPLGRGSLRYHEFMLEKNAVDALLR